MRSSALALAAYLLCRAVLGAALNPLYNGPDESAHVEYVRTLAAGGRASVTGAEARQLPTYYALAVIPWRLSAGQPEAARVFAIRLLSGLAGAATLGLTWSAARRVWPGSATPASVAATATLAPGHLFVLSSAGNDPLASALAGAAFLAALVIWLEVRAGRAWWAAWLLASLAALATKPTTLPVVGGAALALAFRWRRPLLRPWWTRLALGAGAVAAGAANVWLALAEPTSSGTAALARFWPVALIRAPGVYLAGGGLFESFRTWWYGYDYLVRWPRMPEGGAALLAGLLTGAALLGLGIALAGRRGPRVPGIVWWCAVAQIALVLGRYGFGDVLQIEMGGAAQAKAFLAGVVPLSLAFAAGLVAAGSALRIRARWLTAGFFGSLLALDGVSLAVTLWQHYRWWQLAA